MTNKIGGVVRFGSVRKVRGMSGRRGFGVVAAVTTVALWLSLFGAAEPAKAALAVGSRATITSPEALEQTPVQPVVPLPDATQVVPDVQGRVPVWPTPGEARVPALVPGGAAWQVSGQPVRIALAADTTAVGELGVRSESRATVEGLVGGGLGAAWTLTGPAGADVEVTVDYAGFASAASAGWSSRLGLVALPACATSTPDEPECRTASPLTANLNSTAAGSVSGRVRLTSPEVVVLLAATTTAHGAGDFAATPLAASSSWVSGGASGAFSWSYPLSVPPAAGGLAPSLAITYDSNVANGRTSGSNNQPSWVGEGFELASGFIERKYAQCADEAGEAGSNNTVKTGDLCWGIDEQVSNNAPFDNATLSLAGHSGELVRVGNTAQWRLKIDDGTRVEKVGSVGSSSESWKVTTTEGTQYFFGKASVNGIATNSVWKVPVAGNDDGEPGHASSFASSFSSVAWRWNLDSVVSITGDSMTYIYTVETNKYNKNLTTATSYDRGGYLSEVHYGERSGSESSNPAGKVVFTVAERCYSDGSLSDCGSATPNADNGFHWPDVPVDAICTGSSCTTTQTSPTFFTRKRLSRVDTYMGGVNVDRWSLSASYPDPGDNSPAVLWPVSIQHKAMSGTQITLPAVTLTPTMRPNRITGLDTGSALTRPRLGQVTTETGAQIIANYTGPADCDGNVAPASNTQQCFPGFYSQGGESSLEWFNQWLADSVWEYDTAAVVDQNGTAATATAQAKRTSYTYSGGGAWRYDDSPLTRKKYRTWNNWRGYQTVTTTLGDPALGDDLLVTLQTFYRGMHGDKAAGGGTKTVQVTDSTGATVDDLDWLAGMTREVRTLTAVGGGEVTGQIDDRWVSGTKADNGRRQAKVVGTSETRTRQTTSTGVRATRTTITARNSDELPTQTEATGDTAVTGDETCTRTSYAASNTTAWIVGKLAEASVMPALCSTAPDLGQMISDVKHYHDGSTTLGASPTKGLETRTDTITGSTTRTWATSTATYDQHGRMLTATDALGNTTTTSYTPATGSPVTQVKTVSADPDGTGPLTAHTTTITVDPQWGVPTKQVAPGGQTTTATVDSLGRVTSVWKPGRDTGSSASVKYTYTVNASGVNAVKTETLKADGTSYLASYTLYDSLLRSRQTQTVAANGTGRVINDTQYDARGLAWRTLTYWGAGDPAAVMVEAAPTSAIPYEARTTYDYAARPNVAAFYAFGYEQWRTTTSYTGDTTTVVPPAGGTPTTTTTDVQGRTTALTQHLGVNADPGVPQSVTSYTYNPAGLLASTTDPKGNTWTYSYDVQGNRLTTNDPDKGTTTNTYDLLGHQLTSTDARGRGVATTYDKLYRVVATTDLTGNPLTTTSWDTLKAGLVTQTSRNVAGAQLVEKVNSYDTAGRPTSASMVVPTVAGVIPSQLAGTYTTTTSYNPDGSTNTVGLPATGPVPAENLAYTYTATNLPNATTGTPSGGTAYPYANATVYTPLGEIQWLKLGVAPYNSQLKYDYDLSTRRLSTVSHYLNSTLAEQTGYTYTNSGLVTSQTTQPQTGAADTQCYSYDYQQQLTQAWTPASNDCAAAPSQTGLGGPAPYWSSWTTDTIGKTSQRVDRTPTTSTTLNYTYNNDGTAQPHAVTATTGSGGDKTYSIDQAGNTTSRPNAATTQTLAWNDEGKLATITDGLATIQTNLYNAAGDRVVRAEAGRTTLYVAGTELTYTTATGALTANRSYTHAGQAIATRTGAANTTVTTLIPDRQGTTHQQVNTTTGNIATTWHAPYGLTRTNPSGWIGERGYVGGTNDTTTGLVHIGARDYDTTLNRFITTDPIHDLADPLNYNPYTYANNNPTTNSDPTGLYSSMDGYADPAAGVHGDLALPGVHVPVTNYSNTNNYGDSGSPPKSTTTTKTTPAQTPTSASATSTATATSGTFGTWIMAPYQSASLGNVTAPTPPKQPIGEILTESLIGLGAVALVVGCIAVGVIECAIGAAEGELLSASGGSIMVGGGAMIAIGIRARNILGQSAGAARVATNTARSVGTTVGDLRAAGQSDAHHIIQDAAVRDLPGYATNAAPGVQLAGPSTLEGSAHYEATVVQRAAGGGTYGAERQIAYNALKAAGYSDAEAAAEIARADAYFIDQLGVTMETPTRVPGNRAGG